MEASQKDGTNMETSQKDGTNMETSQKETCSDLDAEIQRVNAAAAAARNRQVIADKELRRDLDSQIQKVKELPPSRERSLAITKLQEAVMWLGMDLMRCNQCGRRFDPDESDCPCGRSQEPEEEKEDPMKAQTENTRTTDANKTVAPVEPGVVGSPEFCRPADVRRLFGIGRSYCYELIQSGAIRSICLRRRGKRTGVRLIDVASVRDYLRGQFTTDAKGN
jgi:hypothetical protein